MKGKRVHYSHSSDFSLAAKKIQFSHFLQSFLLSLFRQVPVSWRRGDQRFTAGKFPTAISTLHPCHPYKVFSPRPFILNLFFLFSFLLFTHDGYLFTVLSVRTGWVPWMWRNGRWWCLLHIGLPLALLYSRPIVWTFVFLGNKVSSFHIFAIVS